MEAKKVIKVNLEYDEWTFLESFMDRCDSCIEDIKNNKDIKLEIDDLTKDTLDNLYDTISNLLDAIKDK